MKMNKVTAAIVAERRRRVARIKEHEERVASLPPLKPGEAETLIQEHIRCHGVTHLPVRYVGEVFHQMEGYKPPAPQARKEVSTKPRAPKLPQKEKYGRPPLRRYAIGADGCCQWWE
jgi:hypothetical protein